MSTSSAIDQRTADAFATSWNTLPEGSVYSQEQVKEWFAPLDPSFFQGKKVLELGCGNGSFLMHVGNWDPKYLEGVDLGDSVLSARNNMRQHPFKNWQVIQEDLTKYNSQGFDLVYCIGVLHHLKDPFLGFNSVIKNVKQGGSFHCWVYAHEGNAIIRWLVDPLRKMFSSMPWWFTKYLVALPLSIPFFLYSKLVGLSPSTTLTDKLPLAGYSRWISKREFRFFWHVAFDQLVTPQTSYIKRETVEEWLNSSPRILKDSTYIIFRNGNSWKFGGNIAPES